MTEAAAAPTPSRPWLAWLWLAAVLALAVQQVGFWREARLDSDVMALLPGAASDPLLDAASQRMADAATRQVVVLLSADDWAATRRAADAFAAALPDDGPLRAIADDDAGFDAALAFYTPFRRALLTHEQRAQLESTPPGQLADLALARLFGPGAGGFGGWRADPLGLWPDWWQARAGRGLQPRDGQLALQADARDWAVLRFEQPASAFRLDGERHLHDALDRASTAARTAAGGDLRELHGGVPLHAEAAAARAAWEVNTIGLGSLLAVVTLVWLAFRSPRPMLLVALSLVIGMAAAVAVTSLVFDRVHLLTLVFGASLVGVAEDYGIHYFACRQGQPKLAPRALMRQLLPALSVALATSVLAYAALGIAPFPGLRQMAVFAAVGLTAAFLTAVLWFPWLDRGVPKHSRFAAWIAGTLARWPRWRADRRGVVIAVVVAALAVPGLAQLRVDDDLRSLQASPPDLLAQEIEVGRLLGLPSPAQFFLVEGADAQDLLRREETLTTALAVASADGRIAGWRAVSDWLPSWQRQADDNARVQGVETIALARAAELAGEPLPTSAKPTPQDLGAAAPDDAGGSEAGTSPHDGDGLLHPDAWLAHPVSAPLRPLWLGEHGGRWGSVVMLQGLRRDTLADVAALADGLPGVRWIDRTATYSALLSHYRRQMSWLLLAGYAAVAVVLVHRYRRLAWRALLPTVLAAMLALSVLGWLGVPLQLFGVLAQLLLLGIGIDYGIFLLEHRGDGASWLAVCLGAASTLLAFGLLALSATPALHGFGLTLLLGIGAVWLLSPCFRADPAHPPSTDHP